MNLFFPRYILQFRFASPHSTLFTNNPYTTIAINKQRRFSTISLSISPKSELLVVVGGGAAGIYGAIRAKTLAPNLNVVVVEKGKPLSKVKISGGGRCNVTNGHCPDNMIMADHYPRGYRELKGSFFNTHGPVDTMSWFCDHGVELKVFFGQRSHFYSTILHNPVYAFAVTKIFTLYLIWAQTEDDGRVFPVSNSSSSVIDCLMSEVKRTGVVMQTGKVVTTASTAGGKFILKIEKRTIDYVESVEADYLFIASGSSQQGYALATQLGHSIIDPVPSLFTFKIDDSKLTELSGVTFVKVKAKLELETLRKNIQQLTQVGPMLVTHWGLSGPVILRLSAWGARDLSSSDYKGILYVDFTPDLHIEHMKSVLIQHKNQFAKLKMLNSYPVELGLVKRFWKYLLDREGIDGDLLWASVSNSSIMSTASLLKQCPFKVKGKGIFKDEFVTAGGVPLSEISLKTMESKLQPRLFFAGEVLNIDGVTGGFNFQNAWSGGHIAVQNLGMSQPDTNSNETFSGLGDYLLSKE